MGGGGESCAKGLALIAEKSATPKLSPLELRPFLRQTHPKLHLLRWDGFAPVGGRVQPGAPRFNFFFALPPPRERIDFGWVGHFQERRRAGVFALPQIGRDIEPRLPGSVGEAGRQTCTEFQPHAARERVISPEERFRDIGRLAMPMEKMVHALRGGPLRGVQFSPEPIDEQDRDFGIGRTVDLFARSKRRHRSGGGDGRRFIARRAARFRPQVRSTLQSGGATMFAIHADGTYEQFHVPHAVGKTQLYPITPRTDDLYPESDPALVPARCPSPGVFQE